MALYRYHAIAAIGTKVLLQSPSSVSVIVWLWGNLSAVVIREAIAGHEDQVKFISEPDMVCMRQSTRVSEWRRLIDCWLPLHPTCYIKREVMMRCGLYDDSYKIAADTNFLVNYLYNCHLKVAYLPEFVMRMGGMSTDSAKRKKVWDEDIRVYTGYGFKPVTLTKLMKMAWKVPQFIQAKFMK